MKSMSHMVASERTSIILVAPYTLHCVIRGSKRYPSNELCRWQTKGGRRPDLVGHGTDRDGGRRWTPHGSRIGLVFYREDGWAMPGHSNFIECNFALNQSALSAARQLAFHQPPGGRLSSGGPGPRTRAAPQYQQPSACSLTEVPEPVRCAAPVAIAVEFFPLSA